MGRLLNFVLFSTNAFGLGESPQGFYLNGRQCNFSQSGLTFLYNPANAARTSGQQTVYTFQRIGSTVYVSWIAGFQ